MGLLSTKYFFIIIPIFCLIFFTNVRLNSMQATVKLPKTIQTITEYSGMKTEPIKGSVIPQEIRSRRNILDISILILKSKNYENEITKLNLYLNPNREETFSFLEPIINSFITDYYNLFIKYCIENNLNSDSNVKTFFTSFLKDPKTTEILTKKIETFTSNMISQIASKTKITKMKDYWGTKSAKLLFINCMEAILLKSPNFLNNLNLSLFGKKDLSEIKTEILEKQETDPTKQVEVKKDIVSKITKIIEQIKRIATSIDEKDITNAEKLKSDCQNYIKIAEQAKLDATTAKTITEVKTELGKAENSLENAKNILESAVKNELERESKLANMVIEKTIDLISEIQKELQAA